MTGFNKVDFQKIFDRMVESDKFSGVVLVAKGDEIIFEKAYGYACKNFEVPNQIDTIFNIGSLNKVVTKIAILQEEHLFDRTPEPRKSHVFQSDGNTG